MVNIISRSEVHGQLILALRDGGHCKFPTSYYAEERPSNVLRSVNWYQRNYPYVWATARLVQDL